MKSESLLFGQFQFMLLGFSTLAGQFVAIINATDFADLEPEMSEISDFILATKKEDLEQIVLFLNFALYEPRTKKKFITALWQFSNKAFRIINKEERRLAIN